MREAGAYPESTRLLGSIPHPECLDTQLSGKAYVPYAAATSIFTVTEALAAHLGLPWRGSPIKT